MLNDHQRHALKQLARQLEDDDPAWVRHFLTFTVHDHDVSSTAEPSIALTVGIILAVILMLLGALIGNPQMFVTFCGTTLVLTLIRRYL